jgi:type IX secretion system PorP/SprF family membrane protein
VKILIQTISQFSIPMKPFLSALFFALFFLNCQPISAQLQPIFTLYRDQATLINPAIPNQGFTISDFPNSISASYRYQWFNVPDAPITQVLNWETMLDRKNLLVGVYLMNDKTGDIGFTNAYARCAYRLMFSEMDKRYMTIGMSVGASRFYANLANYAAEQGFALQNGNAFMLDINTGIYYNHGNRFYAGLSVPQMLGTPHILETATEKKASIKRPQHIYGTFGYYFDAPYLGSDVAYLEPNVWLRYLPATQTFGIDAGVRAKISELFWAGTSYNVTAKTLNIELGTVLGESAGFDSGQLRIGFGFVVPMDSYWNALGTGGEVHLNYSWGRQ